MPQHPEELQAHDGLVYYNREPGGMLCLPVDGEPASFRIRVRMRTDSGHQLLEGARAGLGLAILPSFLAADALLAGELLPVLPGYSPDGGQVSVVYRKTQRTPRKILVLGQFLWKRKSAIRRPGDRALIERGLLPPGWSSKPEPAVAFRCLSPRARRARARCSRQRSGYGRTPCTNPKPGAPGTLLAQTVAGSAALALGSLLGGARLGVASATAETPCKAFDGGRIDGVLIVGAGSAGAVLARRP